MALRRVRRSQTMWMPAIAMSTHPQAVDTTIGARDFIATAPGA